MRKLARWATAAGLLALAAWLVLSYAVAWRLTRREHARRPEPPPALEWASPEALVLRTGDGEELGAWWFEGRAGGPVAILLHGKGGTRRSCLPQARLFLEAGASVLAVTLRCHGDSSGEVEDFGWSAAGDVLAAVEYAESRAPGRPIVVRGTSLGAAAAVFAAERLGTRVAAYVLEGLYRDLRSAARNRLEIHLPPPLDRVAYLGLLLAGPWVIDEPERIAPVRAIASIPVEVPVLLVAGGADRHARLEEARELLEAVRTHARLVVLEGAGHDLRGASPAQYREAVLDFLDAVASSERTPAGSGRFAADGALAR